MSIQKIFKYLLGALLFLLPWQTRFIYEPAFINGAPWEYGTKSLYGTEIILGMLILVGCILILRNRLHFRIPLSKPIGWFVAVTALFFLVIAVVQSVNAAISYHFVVRLLLLLSLPIFVACVQLPRLYSIASLWLGGVFQGVLAVYQFVTQEVVASTWLGLASHRAADRGASVIEIAGERWLRAYGSFGSPNSLGIYLAVIFILGMVLYLLVEKKKLRVIILLGQLSVFSGLILSFSRGSWAAAAAGFIALIILATKEQRIDLLKQSVVYFLLAFFLIIPRQQLFLARFTPTHRLEARSLNERTSQMAEVLEIIREQSVFRGVGPGAYTHKLFLRHPASTAYDLQPVHNIYLLFLAEWGVFISFVVAVLYLAFLKKIWFSRTLFFAGLVVLGVAGLFDHWLYSLFAGQLLWFVVWGIALTEQKSCFINEVSFRPAKQ